MLAGREGADVLLVTDGQSHALDVHVLARRGARFTVVLVGEDSLAANVGHLAALTGGQIFVSSGLDLAEVLQQAIASLRGDRLDQPRIEGKAPDAAATLMGGMRVTARWEPAQRPSLSATTAEAEAGRAIAAYAAWLALPCMAEEEAAALAEAEGVVCHLTSMVLVDTAGEAQQGIPAQRKVPLMSLALLVDPHPLIPMDAACYPAARSRACALLLGPLRGWRRCLVRHGARTLLQRTAAGRSRPQWRDVQSRACRMTLLARGSDIPTFVPHPGQTKVEPGHTEAERVDAQPALASMEVDRIQAG